MKTKLAVAALAIVFLAGACGGADDAGNSDAASRTVAIEMRDIEYSVTSLDVEKGETVRFEFTNTGRVDHDAFIGDEDAQADHGKGMTMHDHGSESDAVTVKPGKTGSLTHTFDEAGETIIGCHETGHYAAGMKIVVTVT